MWKKILLALLIIIVVCAVIELILCQSYYNTYIDLDGLVDTSKYETENGNMYF